MDADANPNTYANANANANANARGSTIALHERCSGELKIKHKKFKVCDLDLKALQKLTL